LDSQLTVFVELATTVYNSGDDIKQCEAVQEYERSGRKDTVDETEKCTSEEVKALKLK
jgi:hypothetical protein